MHTSKQLGRLALMPLVVGIAVLAQLITGNRFASIRTVDLVQLIGSGMCFGAAITRCWFSC